MKIENFETVVSLDWRFLSKMIPSKKQSFVESLKLNPQMMPLEWAKPNLSCLYFFLSHNFVLFQWISKRALLKL